MLRVERSQGVEGLVRDRGMFDGGALNGLIGTDAESLLGKTCGGASS